MTPPRTCLVGVAGYGRVHLQHLLDFHARGELEFVAAVVYPPESDPDIVPALERIGCTVVDSFDQLVAALGRLRAEVCIVPTPIHLHAQMAITLLRAGVHVLVEKPIAASLAEAAAIARAAREHHRIVAVGFQYLHAPEVLALKARLHAGALGRLRRLTFHAAWPRSHAYYARNNWAGRLEFDGQAVLDSPINNAMSHFLMLMLFLAGPGAADAATPVQLTAELYRAQHIQSFDTGVLHLETATGCRLEFYGTHSSLSVGRPSLLIEGSEGSAEWEQDGFARLQGRETKWEMTAGPEAETRDKMLRDFLARLRGEPAFICTPELAAAHVRCVVALHAQIPITTIPSVAMAQRWEDGEVFTYLPGLDEWLAAAARHGTSLATAGAPWGVAPQRIALDGRAAPLA